MTGTLMMTISACSRSAVSQARPAEITAPRKTSTVAIRRKASMKDLLGSFFMMKRRQPSV